jgi:putative ATPase
VIVTLEPLGDGDIRALVERAIVDPRGLAGRLRVDEEAIDVLVRMSAGDARRALTALDAAALGSSDAIDVAAIEAAVMHVAVRYDKDGDQHYDVISAFIKSVRGSDPDAALHYLARMIAAGEDPRFIARRLMILASEDIGMADPSVLLATVAAAQAVAMIGMPEARIILAHVTIQAALAPKSNSVITAIDEALRDVQRGRIGTVPMHLRDAHYPGAAGLGHGTDYVYPHDVPEGVAIQQYLPDELRDRDYYRPGDHGAEARWSDVLARLDQLRGGGAPDSH